MTLSIREVLQCATTRLLEAGVDTPDLDSALLLGHCLKKSRTALYLMADVELEEHLKKNFLELLARREQREPLAYITGVQEFWSLDFMVSPATLIPRPETELLLEQSISAWREKDRPNGSILDLCTGSGIIAIVLAKELGQQVVAIDYSMAALQVARENARRHDVSHLISFVQSDLISAFQMVPQFSMVVSNPPYVSCQELMYDLMPEVELYEPHLALDGGDGGLHIIKQIHAQLPQVLCKDSVFLMEIGAGQGGAVSKIFSVKEKTGRNFRDLVVEKDYNNHDRIFHASY